MGMNDNKMLQMLQCEDEELTSLAWLQDQNLLQNLGPQTLRKEDNENVSPHSYSSSVDEIITNSSYGPSVDNSEGPPCTVPPVTYNPRVHVHAKPPYSFSSLIFMAIESSPSKALPVKDIYAWILENFPYYQTAPDGWKNTVRHNLSLNKCFQKVDKLKTNKKQSHTSDAEICEGNSDTVIAKGSLWCVDPYLRPNLLQAVKKTPAHIYPYMSTAKSPINPSSDSFSPIKILESPNKTDSTQIKINQSTFSTIQTNAQMNEASTNKKSIFVEKKVTVANSTSQAKSDSTNQIIAIEKLPVDHKLMPLLPKRVLIPIGKVGRAPEEADVAESMLTLTQCNNANLDGSNIYIITNKNDDFIPILAENLDKDAIENSSCESSLMPANFNTSTDHNYSSREDNHETSLKLMEEQVLEVENSVHTITVSCTEEIADKSNEELTEVTLIPVDALENSVDKNAIHEDEDGLKCAEALYNLANAGSSIKLSTSELDSGLCTSINSSAQEDDLVNSTKRPTKRAKVS